ncbi:MAG: carbohydrate kinase family protein [Vulcanimicrobiota bacterium]
MSRLLVTGSLAYDYILKYPGLLQESFRNFHEKETSSIFFHTDSMNRYFGGCGGNVSYTLALLGEHPRLLSVAGMDTEDYFKHLQEVGVDCDFIRLIEDERSATCLIVNDQAENRYVAFHGGVVDRASELSVKGAVDEGVIGCLITPDDVPAMVKFASECRELGLPFYFDFGSQVTWMTGEQLRDSLEGARAAFCNEYEFSVFEKKTGWDLPRLLESVPTMVITRGREGCDLFRRGEEAFHLSACPLRKGSLDPSGAGDAFRAGFGFGRIHGWPWEAAAMLASTAAAFALEARGTQGHRFTLEELLERCQEAYGKLPQELLSKVAVS